MPSLSHLTPEAPKGTPKEKDDMMKRKFVPGVQVVSVAHLLTLNLISLGSLLLPIA